MLQKTYGYFSGMDKLTRTTLWGASVLFLCVGCATAPKYGAPLVTAPVNEQRYMIKNYYDCEEGVDHCWYTHTTLNRYWQNEDNEVCNQDSLDRFIHCRAGELKTMDIEEEVFIKHEH